MSLFDLVVVLFACLVVSAPLICRRIYDFVDRKRFERMVDRVGGR